MSTYLDIPAFKVRSIMPNEQIDRIEQLSPGWLAAQFESSSQWVDMHLAKRLKVPVANPKAVEAARSWVARMVTLRAYHHHGGNADDQQVALVTSDADKAEEEVKAAANGELSLIDWQDEAGISDVRYGGTRVYSEAGPYVSKRVQRERARNEDRGGRGSGS